MFQWIQSPARGLTKEMKSAVEIENRFAADLTSVPDSLALGYRPTASDAGQRCPCFLRTDLD